MKYRREIDGLRALAVMPVILFHAGFQTFSGGFVGVDIFFVISGYLITSIILAEKQTGTFSIINFYERRARRILPALFLVMFVCLPFAWLWLLPEDMQLFSESLIAVPVFASNILFWKRNANYFGASLELNPLVHTWSLAVEEQYYVLFPLFLILIWKLGRQGIIRSLAVIALISLATAQWGAFKHPTFTFFLLPTRGWEILIGAFIAFYAFKESRNEPRINAAHSAASIVGMLLIIYAILAFDKQTPFPSLYTLVPTIGTALIILFATQETIIGKLLGNKLLVRLGLISYSAYLWHQPLFAYARYRSIYEPSQVVLWGLIIATMLAAYLSWRFVETPFRDKRRISRHQVFYMAALFSALFVSVGLIGTLNKGYPDTFNRVPLYVSNLPELEFPRINNGWCFYNVDDISELSVGDNGLKCLLGDKSSKIKGLLLGDSFAGQYEPFWDIVGKKSSVSINSVTTGMCQPSISDNFYSSLFDRSYLQCLIDRHYFIDHVSDYDLVIFGGIWGDIYSKDRMQDVYDAISFAAGKTKLVVIMASPLQFDYDVGSFYKKSLFYHSDFRMDKISREKDKAAIEANNELKKIAQKYPNVLYIDRDSMFNVHGHPSDATKDNIPFSFDGRHISIYGSKEAAKSFLVSKKYKDFIDLLHN